MTVRLSYTLLLVALTGVVWAPATTAAQEVPYVLQYDGRLNVEGIPAEGTFEITFQLFAEPRNGQSIWTESHQIEIENGHFSVLLGNDTSLQPVVAGNHDALYLSMQVGDEEEMTPRLRMASTAFAFRSAVTDAARDGSIGTSALADASVTNAKLADGGVNSAKIENGAVSEGKLANGAVTRAKLAAGAAVTTLNGRSGPVTITAGSNVNVSEDDGEITISAEGGGGGDITAVRAGDGLNGGGDQGEVTLSLRDGAVTESKLANSAVTVDKLANQSVISAKLANQSVTSSKLADGSVTFAKLAQGAAVTSLNNRSGPITLQAGDNIDISEQGSTIVISASGILGRRDRDDDDDDDSAIRDGFMTGSRAVDGFPELADQGVTTTKLADGAVTASKLADSSVTSAKLQADAAVMSLNGLASNVTLQGSSDIQISMDGNTIAFDYVGPSVLTQSSRRLKSNIETLEDAIQIVTRLRGVSFEWNDDGRSDIGLIAEEVADVVPEVVSFDENGTDALAINYGRLVSLLIEAVKAQQAELDSRETAVADLTSRVEHLELLVARISAAE